MILPYKDALADTRMLPPRSTMPRRKTAFEEGCSHLTSLRKTTTNDSGSEPGSLFVEYEPLSKKSAGYLVIYLAMHSANSARGSERGGIWTILQHEIVDDIGEIFAEKQTEQYEKSTAERQEPLPLQQATSKDTVRNHQGTATRSLMAQARPPQSHASALPTACPSNALLFIHQHTSILGLILNTLPV